MFHDGDKIQADTKRSVILLLGSSSRHSPSQLKLGEDQPLTPAGRQAVKGDSFHADCLDSFQLVSVFVGLCDCPDLSDRPSLVMGPCFQPLED